MPKRGIVLMGQSNGFSGYAEDRIDAFRTHPNLWQFKNNGTFEQSPVQPMDFQNLGNPNRKFVSYVYFWIRDYLIPRNPGVDYCILPQSVGGTGFTLWWHAPSAALTVGVGSTGKYPLGADYYEKTITQMNAFLGAETGNTIECVVLQNGEQDSGDAGSNIGYYHASFSLTDKQAYTRYVTEMMTNMRSRVAGTYPLFIGQCPPDLVYPQSVVGPSADGLEHSGAQYIPIFEAQAEMPGNVSNCAYLNSLQPIKVLCHHKVMSDGNDNYHQDGSGNPVAGGDGIPDVIMNSGNYWLHTCQAGHHVMAHELDRKHSYLKNGKRIISLTYGIATSTGTPDTPTLALASASGDSRPDFDIGIPMTAQIGDIIRVQANSADYTVHTLVSANFTTSTISKTGITPLADGSYSYRARLERGGTPSAWSAVVTGTIDTTLPVLTAATGSAPSNTTASLSVTTNKAGGTMYWVVTTSTTKPTALQIKTGKDHLGANALGAASKAVSVSGVQSTSVSDLTTSGTRYAHSMQEDASANQSAVATSNAWSQVGGAWTIGDLAPALWIDVSDTATLFQNITGTVAANTDGQPIGTIKDKSGNGFDLTATGDDATRPTLRTGAYPYIELDGVDDKLRRLANLALYTGGTGATVFAAVRGNPPSGLKVLVAENSTQAIVEYLKANQTTATTLSVFIRDDTGGGVIVNQADITEPNAFDNTDNVVGVTDTGTLITSYMDGVSTDSKAYTRSSAVTPTRFCIGADYRSNGASWFTGRVYALVAVRRVLDDTERGKLITALAAKMGRVL